ncbi:hypothetical protein B0F90DRAFT_1695286, partial [Multifurca ochricompacta]
MNRRKLVASSKKPGRTKTLTFFRVGPERGKVILVDSPGYGERGRPEWGELFEQYLKSRRELARVYLVINAKHGLNEADRIMLQDLDKRIQSSRNGHIWSFQAIITKADLYGGDGISISSIKQSIFDIAPTCLPPIVTAPPLKLGINDVRKSMMEACDL